MMSCFCIIIKKTHQYINRKNDGINKCTQSARDFAKQQGGLDLYPHIAPYYNCIIDDDEMINYYNIVLFAKI